MNIITENGKDYLDTYFAKLDNKSIDATPLFVESQEFLNKLLNTYNKKFKNNFSYLDKNMYGYPIQSMLNRFSGNYFSASFMKGYITNPATCFYGMFCREEKTDATAIGSVSHEILEKYYKQQKEDRTIESLNKIIQDNTDVDKVREYVSNYIKTPDYLDKRDDKSLDCICEHSGRTKISIPKFGVELPECAYVIDRIDFRDDKIYIIDYKTGTVNKNSLTFNGNLGQMILYKWVVEQEYNREVEKVFICDLKNSRYLEVDCSEENQKILIDQIQDFFTKFKKDNQTRIYEYTDKGYFTNRDLKEFRQIMNDSSIQMAKIPVKIYIGEHENSCLDEKDYTGD